MAERIKIENVTPNMVLARDDLEYPVGALQVMDNVDDCYPMGGGRVMRTSQVLERYSFHIPTEDELKERYKAGHFGFDSGDGEPNFPGWHSGDNWNGWAVPCFAKAVAQEALEYTLKNCEGEGTWSYDEASDTFTLNCSETYDEDEQWKGHDITLEDGTTARVYAIGAYCWCWWNFEKEVADVRRAGTVN